LPVRQECYDPLYHIFIYVMFSIYELTFCVGLCQRPLQRLCRLHQCDDDNNDDDDGDNWRVQRVSDRR